MNEAQQYDERKLLTEIAAGDEVAFQAVFTHWSSRLYGFTLQLAGSKETAEDIVQDTFLKIWLRRDRLSEITNFSAYLFSMARHAVGESLRRRALEAVIVEKNSPEENYETESQLHIKLVKNVLEQAVRNLPAQQEKVWRMRREYGQRVKEIAMELGVSESTVKEHLRLAQGKLKAELVREFPMEGGILLVILGWVS